MTAADERIASLEELVLDMYGFIERIDDGCCKTGECWYERRMRELRVEVDG